MRNRIGILMLLFLFNSLTAFSQVIKGHVYTKTENGREALPGSIVYWLNSGIGTQSDINGEFQIKKQSTEDKKLVIEAFGYYSDTVTITEGSPVSVTLSPQTENLKEVVLKSGPANEAVLPEAIKTEVVDAKELTKAACCDLAGCFETQATVQPVTTNIITNSKELRILGLSGVYNQVLIDGMPMVQGLTYTYGISGYPGTLVDNIYIAKGANSVLQGFESITGSINVTLKDPDEGNRVLGNVFMNSFGEKHINANYSKRWKRWSSLTSFHTVQPGGRFDRDKDTFLDVPLLTRYMLYNKFKYKDEDSLGLSTMIGIRYLNEKRIGGQTSFMQSMTGDTTVYGQVVNYDQPEIYTKSGYRFSKKKKLTLISSAYLHNQSSFFGNIAYKARQKSFYSNVQYELDWRSHQFKTGISYRHLYIRENISFTGKELGRTYSGTYLKNEIIPGAFAENSFNWKDEKITLITGLRIDHHNNFGFFATPRSLLKYQLRKKSTVRLSAGTGYRTVNLISENINLLVSSRDIVITEPLKPERAINWGINFTEKIDGKKAYGTVSVDFYQTRFLNQIFPDYNTDPTKAYISNFEGTSISNGFQAEGSFNVFDRFDTKLAYVFLDVFRVVDNQKQTLPFNSKHKIMGSLSYEPKSQKWHADLNFHWYGSQNLPETSANPEEFKRPSKSEPYTIVSAQFTKVWKKFELYAGCENILDFRQTRPIMSWENPFGPYFDSSFAWGPTRGREFYAGVRFNLK